MQFNQARAFSLIELMLTISIIALLTAVAAPTYQSYVDRVQAKKVIDLFPDLQNRWTLFNGGFEPAPTIMNPLPEISAIEFYENFHYNGPVDVIKIQLAPASANGFRFISDYTVLNLRVWVNEATGNATWSCTYEGVTPEETLEVIRRLFPDCTCAVGFC